jgi:hypothetical protein
VLIISQLLKRRLICCPKIDGILHPLSKEHKEHLICCPNQTRNAETALLPLSKQYGCAQLAKCIRRLPGLKMEETKASGANRLWQYAVNPSQAQLLVAAPKEYFLGPVFAASKQAGPREVTIGDHRYQIGGFHPLRPDLRPPALDVRHARAIFSLLSFRDPYEDSRLVRFSFNEFCRRYANSNGGRYARAIADIVADLLDAYIRVTDVNTGISHQYRLIEHVDIEGRPPRRKDALLANSAQQEMWFNGCTLSPEFFGLLSRIAELQSLKLDVFTAIRSPLAQAIYLYIPSRAHHHSREEPFEITLTRLLEQVSFPIPVFKSQRKQIFTQHEKEGRSVLQQLDGIETLSGRFHAVLAETSDGTDWKFLAWVDKSAKKPKSPGEGSKLVAAYVKSGRPRELLDQALSEIRPLDDYELGMLETAGVVVGKNRRFFEMAKAILKETRFNGLLSEAKGDELEGRKAQKNATARLIHRIMEAVGAPVATSKAVQAAQR